METRDELTAGKINVYRIIDVKEFIESEPEPFAYSIVAMSMEAVAEGPTIPGIVIRLMPDMLNI